MKRAALLLILVLPFACKDQGTNPVNPEITIQSLFALNGNGRVTLGWTPPFGNPPEEIRIYKSTTPNFSPSPQNLYASLPGTADRFIDSMLANGSSLYYRIVTTKRNNGIDTHGEPSNIAIARPFDYSSITTIRYDEHIQPIFTSSCAVRGCHVGEENGGQFSLQSWSDLLNGSEDGAAIVAYKASKSDLIFHVSSDSLVAPTAEPHMPLPDFNLPAEQVRTLIRWVDEGAPNQQGDIPFTTTPQGKVFVVNSSEDLVAVRDVETNLVIRYVAVGKAADSTSVFGSPHHVKVDSQERYFYVTLINAQQLWKFDINTYQSLGKVPIPGQPSDVVFSSTGDTAYVTSFVSNPGRVTLVDTRSMQVIATILMTGTSNPHGILVSHDGSAIFTTNAGSGNMSIINPLDNSYSLISLNRDGNPFFSPIAPYLVDASPDDRYLFVTDYKATGDSVYVIDRQANPNGLSRVLPVGGRTVHVAFTPDGTRAFVCNLTTGSVNVVRTSDFSQVVIPNVGRQPHGVIFTPDGTTAYITTENFIGGDPPHHPTAGSVGVSFVVVLVIPSLTVVKKIEVGAFSQGIAFAH